MDCPGLNVEDLKKTQQWSRNSITEIEAEWKNTADAALSHNKESISSYLVC